MSVNDAVDEVAELLGSFPDGKPTSGLRDAGVRKVYDHEPATVERGCSVTVSFSGMDPTEWLIAVKVYVADNDPRASQRIFTAAIEAVDDALGAGGHVGPSNWDAGFDPSLEVPIHLAITNLRVPRPDDSMH